MTRTADRILERPEVLFPLYFTMRLEILVVKPGKSETKLKKG